MTFDPKSRYAELPSYTAEDRRGRTVTAISAAEPSPESSMGTHLRLEGQKLDHLAYKYLDNPAGFWRICELNGVMLAEALSEVRQIKIPGKRR